MEETIQPKMKKEKLFKWALWWGLGIVVACLIILLVRGESSEDLDSPMINAMYSLVYQFGILPIVLTIGIFGPIIEESIFRLWGNGKLWTGITSVILMAVVSFAIGWWLALLVAVCGAFILIYFRADRKKKLFYLMLLSSAIFAVAHKGNYSGNWFDVFIVVLHKFGMGLLGSYLVINYNLFWAMVLHAANNMIAAIPLFFAFNSINGDVKVVENEDFRLEMRTVLVKDNELDISDRFLPNQDTNYYFGNTAFFVGKLMFHEPRDWNKEAVKTEGDLYPMCHYNLVFKTKPYNRMRLIQTMVDEGYVKIDTTTLNTVYHVYVADKSKLVSGNKDSLISFKETVNCMRVNMGLPVVFEYNSSYDSLYVKGVNYRSNYTYEEIKPILEEQGVVVEPIEQKMTIINIKVFIPLN